MQLLDERLGMTLDEMMTFGHVVYSDGKGNVTDPEDTEYGPEVVYAPVDSDGNVTGDPIDMAGYYDWELLKGFTRQYGVVMTEIMHESEFIGGRLETHIRENRGLYVALMVDSDDWEDEPENRIIGWAVAFKEV